VRAGLRVPAAAGIILLGGVAGYFAAHLASQARDEARVDTSPTPAPASLKEEAARPAPPPRVIPTVLPSISLADTSGVKHPLSEWKGRPLMVNFWATWCEPCRREIPLLKKLRQERSADGLEVVGIAVDFRDAVQKYAHDMGIDYPVLVGEQDGLDAIAQFGMDTVFPFTVFADRQGRIVTLKIGELHAEEARFILDEVKAVDEGRTELAAARKEIADGVAALVAERAKREEGSRASAPQGDAPAVLRN
jgi:thiol-disulfide isomerase/thioredoxin